MVFWESLGRELILVGRCSQSQRQQAEVERRESYRGRQMVIEPRRVSELKLLRRIEEFGASMSRLRMMIRMFQVELQRG